MLKFSVPPGYVRKGPPLRPKLDGFTGIIDAILTADRDRLKKQHHTSKRVFERLRDKHGFTGKLTIVKDYVADWRQRTREMFVPLLYRGTVVRQFAAPVMLPISTPWRLRMQVPSVRP
jgi:hypothetical protein